MDNTRRVRVRFAPSPTGPLHMGGVRTALYNYLFAKKHGGDFILRIEDTDQERLVPGAEEYIINALKWCGIEPNEGIGFGDGDCAPYRQSDRKNAGVYAQYADQLIQSGHAYYAFDTKEELDEQRKRYETMGKAFAYNALTRQNLKNSLTLSEDEVKTRIAAGEHYVIRTKIPRNEEIRFHDIIRGWVVVHSSQLDDKVLFKSDGMPTYHLANIVDDYSMKISHVIRGEEWLPSAPLHVLLYRFLGWEEVMPQFAHLPLILRPDGNGKLSKRDGDRLGFPVFPLTGELLDVKTGQPEKFTGYREKGYYPEAFINMLALLGWHGSSNQELFTKEELIEAFSLERVSKSGAKFDAEKTKWFNQQYLRKRSDAELAAELLPMLKEQGIETTPAFAEAICRLLKEKVQFSYELRDQCGYFFNDPAGYDEGVIAKRWNEQNAAFMKSLADAFNGLGEWTAATTEACFKATAETAGINAGQVMQLFRVCISGLGGGPVLFELVELLGKETIVRRLHNAVNTIGK
ncbi:MAG: glutamate--tRNA ligase [Bacteroidia bacterium]|jgi:glutamyl-tRNA synthetase|nr:glutamate--tRNA ligase [Bacteroidia bacterium]